MQTALDAKAPGEVVLVSVNATGFESGNADFVVDKTTPLLQDTAAVNAWAAWQVTYRDVVVLDASGARRAVFNLTQNDLSVPANLAALEGLLLGAR
ncbi:MAG: hypothetical protein INH41_07765 [Myxococcaceae bacterium]|nr:hypothetical protein [Myxococcaceae bacterium]MCA3012281.1 hypothetical protein [Myxococcaceae bacterium]